MRSPKLLSGSSSLSSPPLKLTTGAQASVVTFDRSTWTWVLASLTLHTLFSRTPLSLDPPFNPGIEWGLSQTQSTRGRAFFAPPPYLPQIISETWRRSETSEAAFESDRRGTPKECLTFYDKGHV